jgi:uncharacterized protein
MMMEEVFSKLRALQNILSRKIAVEKEIQDIPKVLMTQDEMLNRLRKSYIEKNAVYESSSEKIKDLRQRLEEAETNREKAERQMDAISTQREYEALDKEIRDASEKEQLLRRELQKEEKTLQEVEETLRRDEQMIDEQEGELKEKREKVETETSEKNEVLKSLADEEAGIVPGLDTEILFKFERIIRSKQGVGIVSVRNGVCTGCHMILPTQFVNEVHTGNKIIFCPYCSRILFFQESEESEENYFVDIESGGLSDLDEFEEEDEEEGEFIDEEEDNEKETMSFDEE